MNVDKLEYPSKEVLRAALEKIEDVEIIEETDSHIEIWDNYDDHDRFIVFHKKEFLKPMELVETFGHDITNVRLKELFDRVPLILFMNIKKIYFVRNEKDVENLYDLSPNHTFELKHLGMHVYHDGTIIVNLTEHESCAETEANEDIRVFGEGDKEEHFVRGIWQTIVHELYHSLQENPMFETEIQAGEQQAEDFCRSFVNI